MEKNAHNISQDEFNSLIKKTFSGDLIDPRYWSKSNLDDFIKKLEITKSLNLTGQEFLDLPNCSSLKNFSAIEVGILNSVKEKLVIYIDNVLNKTSSTKKKKKKKSDDSDDD